MPGWATEEPTKVKASEFLVVGLLPSHSVLLPTTDTAANMAGRGRGMTLPAWMTKDGTAGPDPSMAGMPQMPGGLNGGGVPQNREIAVYLRFIRRV